MSTDETYPPAPEPTVRRSERQRFPGLIRASFGAVYRRHYSRLSSPRGMPPNAKKKKMLLPLRRPHDTVDSPRGCLKRELRAELAELGRPDTGRQRKRLRKQYAREERGQ